MQTSDNQASSTPKPKKQSKKWFERYRWFHSLNNTLVVAGKTQRNSETILKRYTKPADIVLHADVPEAPVAVVRNEGQELSAEAVYEAAVLVASYSSAWRDKIEKEKFSVFYVKPDQVALVSRAGSKLSEIKFEGERKFLEKIEPRLSIGVKEERTAEGGFFAKLIFGPPTAVRRQTQFIVTLVPGERSAEELAVEIKKLLLQKVSPEIYVSTEAIELSEIKNIIPFGKGELVT
jgi:hypothetical protein